MKLLISLLNYFLIYLFVALIIVVLGIGTAFSLHLVLRGVDFGTCILAGLLVTGIALHFFLRLITEAFGWANEAGETDTDNVSREFLDMLESSLSRQKRKRT